MSFSFSSNNSVLLRRFILLAAATGIAMLAFYPRAAEADGESTVVSLDCDHAGPFPDSAYGDALEEALTYLEDNTGFPGYSPLDAQYPLGSPRVYARSYYYAERCKECLKLAAKTLLDYCPQKIFGSVKLVSCSLYYGSGPF